MFRELNALAVIAYLIGSVPFGLLVGRSRGQCIRPGRRVEEEQLPLAVHEEHRNNRLEPHHAFKSGNGWGVQAKFPGTGGFVPLGARLPDGTEHRLGQRPVIDLELGLR